MPSLIGARIPRLQDGLVLAVRECFVDDIA